MNNIIYEQTINTVLKHSYNKVLENDNFIAIEQILYGSMVAVDYLIFFKAH